MALSSFLQKLLFVNKFTIKDGEINLLDNPYIMLDASILLTLQEVDESKMYQGMKEGSKKNLKNLVKHAKVYKNIKNQSLKNLAELSKSISKSEEGVIKTLQEIFDVYGLGKMEIEELDNSGKEAKIKITNSTIAKETLKKYEKKSKTPVCTLTAGILAGIFSFLFKKNIDCVEKSCLAKGDDYCFFLVK